MRLVFTRDLIPGMLTGGEVTDVAGAVKLLKQGICLTQSQITKLQNWGVPFLYLDDGTDYDRIKFSGVDMIKINFAKVYQEIMHDVGHMFRYIKKFREVPVMQMKALADHKISLLVETIGALDYLLEMRCHSEHTFQHSLNVAVIAGVLGKWCGYQGEKLKNLVLAGLLHDIGKVVIPLSILDKPGYLSSAEFAIIKQHTAEGYQLVKTSQQISQDVKLSILQHHERMDGSGYPAGLAGDEINDGAKVIAIADIYEAMTSDRVYRSKMTPFEALNIIADQMFVGLKPEICLTFFDNMRNYLTGSSVALSNGLEAKVIAFDAKEKHVTRPILYVQNGTCIDLQKEALRIVGVYG
ncbi:HD-GYP domain-containing protein [Sporomusa aerivorans]|uniref:HD-GYP domain-containing protein n=1 Tax=Sporomusa aerivorans TaxID=204936 RepID=UPI00352A3710